jgi:hypothetical protein
MNGTPIDSYLDSGERLLWSGQPKQGVRLQASDAGLIPFSLMWGGFAIFWEANALGLVPMNHQYVPHAGEAPPSGPPIFMAIWGIPFVVIGLYMMVGRFFVDAATRRKTWYAVTNQRLIILKTFFSTSITSFDYSQLPALNLTERGDRSGDIVFGTPLLTMDAASPTRRRVAAPGFYLLPDARRIYDLIRDVQKDAKK